MALPPRLAVRWCRLVRPSPLRSAPGSGWSNSVVVDRHLDRGRVDDDDDLDLGCAGVWATFESASRRLVTIWADVTGSTSEIGPSRRSDGANPRARLASSSTAPMASATVGADVCAPWWELEDRGPQPADGLVDPVDHAGAAETKLVVGERRPDRRELEPDAEHVLNHSVMQVASDAFPILEHQHALTGLARRRQLERETDLVHIGLEELHLSTVERLPALAAVAHDEIALLATDAHRHRQNRLHRVPDRRIRALERPFEHERFDRAAPPHELEIHNDPGCLELLHERT